MNPHGAAHQMPNRIIVHAMGEWFHYAGKVIPASELLLKSGVSAHVLINPLGQSIRIRADTRGAWHAKNHNSGSLGIEFLVPGIYSAEKYPLFLSNIKEPYLTDVAYTAGLAQVRQWMTEFDIKTIERHSDVDPARKQDPGDGFPWQDFLEDIAI